MAQSARQTTKIPPDDRQTAEYTYDMLTALKELAAARGQATLALLLKAAADEARALATSQRANGEPASRES